MGAARPRAQGQATTSTEIAIIRPLAAEFGFSGPGLGFRGLGFGGLGFRVERALNHKSFKRQI